MKSLHGLLDEPYFHGDRSYNLDKSSLRKKSRSLLSNHLTSSVL